MPTERDERDRNDYREKLLHKLSPEALQQSLQRAGVFLVAYELVKSEIVDKVRGFFISDDVGITWRKERAKEYDDSVLSKDRSSVYRASCGWLAENDGLDPRQIAILESVYQHRHEVAHELAKYLVDPDFEIRMDLLTEAVECIRSLGQFWGSNEVDSDPEFDGREIRPEDIRSGSYVLMEHLVEVIGLGGDG
jgi:hypothetical protein